MKSLLALGLLLSFTSNVFAADLNIASGNYVNGKYCYESTCRDGIQIFKAGSKVQVVDQKNKIRYAADINNSAEQLITPKYLSYVRTRGDAAALGTIVDHITVSNFAQVTPDEISGKINIYILTKSLLWGNSSATLILTGHVKRHREDFDKYDFQGSNHTMTDCLEIATSDNIEIAALKTPFGPGYDKVIGFTVEMALKIASPVLNFYQHDLCAAP